MKNKKIYLLIFCLFSIQHNIFSQQYRSPLDIPLYLSANCGELRANHFHSGIDIKTQAVTGKSVFSVEDGYVSRISVSPSGYGLALYIDHPSTGHTSVYGHLLSFAPKIAKYVKDKQYEKESFKVNLYLSPNQFPVKKGEFIAKSGNSGSSGGPHVHFEIRDTKTEEVLDPLAFYKNFIKDTQAPDVRGIAVYPVPGRGVVNNSYTALHQNIKKLRNGNYSSPQTPIEAWGWVGFGVKSYDRMDKTSNIYGVKIVKLFVDDKKIFESNTKKFSFAQTRMINSFVDFEEWAKHKSFYMRSYIEPGNKLPFYTSKNDGYVEIKEERLYKLKYELEDIYGNKQVYSFNVLGKKQNISIPSGCSLVMGWQKDNRYINEDFSLTIKKGNLYNDICFVLKKMPSTTNVYSNIYQVNKEPIPLNNSGIVRIKLLNDSLTNKNKYGVVAFKGAKEIWLGGTYEEGYISTSIKELGLRLAIGVDDEAPLITPIYPKRWNTLKIVKIKVTDNLSGINSFRGTIDGKYALFEHDVKSTLYTYKMDPTKLEPNKTHNLQIVVKDACGNESLYTGEFYY